MVCRDRAVPGSFRCMLGLHPGPIAEPPVQPGVDLIYFLIISKSMANSCPVNQVSKSSPNFSFFLIVFTVIILHAIV